MTDEELIAYFEHAKLPETLRLDRATRQLRVRESVGYYSQIISLVN
jgi:hypothetical protein